MLVQENCLARREDVTGTPQLKSASVACKRAENINNRLHGHRNTTHPRVLCVDEHALQAALVEVVQEVPTLIMPQHLMDKLSRPIIDLLRPRSCR